jgi:hypothetical protein
MYQLNRKRFLCVAPIVALLVLPLPSPAAPPAGSPQSSGKWLPVNDSDCSTWDPAPLPNETATWNGECSGTPARNEGAGTLTWYSAGVLVERDTGTWNEGRRDKSATSTWSQEDYFPNGNVKTRTTWHGNEGELETFYEDGSPSSQMTSGLQPNGRWTCVLHAKDGSWTVTAECNGARGLGFMPGAPFVVRNEHSYVPKESGVVGPGGTMYPGRSTHTFLDGSSMVVMVAKDGSITSKAFWDKIAYLRAADERNSAVDEARSDADSRAQALDEARRDADGRVKAMEERGRRRASCRERDCNWAYDHCHSDCVQTEIGCCQRGRGPGTPGCAEAREVCEVECSGKRANCEHDCD